MSRLIALPFLVLAQQIFPVLVALAAEPTPVQPAPNVSVPQVPQIADEPKSIDPATVAPAKLAETATHDFTNSSLREVVNWLQTDRGLVVLLDKNALDSIGVSAADPISDRLVDAPVYLLLNRLSSHGIAWYFDDDVLHITSAESAEARATTLTYNVADLLDAKYELDTLESVITSIVAPDSWDTVGGEGVLNSLGDVLFVRQNQQVQFAVQALLAALRTHGRQTFVNDPGQHQALREKLNLNVSVSFLDAPLESAVAQLGEIAKIDVRLDLAALREAKVREREPITLKLADRKLHTALQALVLNLNLTWILRDGVLWITSQEKAESALKTAVYDVRDLCRDEAESRALIDAVTSQTEPSSWDSVGGPGGIESAKPGTLVILHQEQVHRQVLDLLETYRTALRSSRPRPRDIEDPKEVVTVYYRLHANVAESLSKELPKLVQPETWKDGRNTQASGEIFLVSSPPDLSNIDAESASPSEAKPSPRKLITERSVLIVRQSRAVHREIEDVIRRVESGDVQQPDAAMGMGGGMGGFGGGFFSIPLRHGN